MDIDVAALVGPGVKAGLLAVEDHLVGELFDAERALVARAVPKRQRELAAGRVLARRLLGELGFPAGPLLASPDRAPIWPAGAVGSISHTDDLCFVAVARAAEVRAIGVDVEQRKALKRELWRIVLRPGEQAFVEGAPDPGEAAMLVFSAKEALYKAQYPFTKTVLEFSDVELAVDLAAGRFSAEILHACRGSAPRPLEGRFTFADRWVLSAVIVGR